MPSFLPYALHDPITVADDDNKQQHKPGDYTENVGMPTSVRYSLLSPLVRVLTAPPS